MANGRNTRQIKRTRNELLVALKVVYPAALQAEQLMRSLLVLFPTLEFEHVKRDLHYLGEKGYIERVIADPDSDNGLTPWRRRWFKLTPLGVELADRCIKDPALEEG
jgi:hypothetical protein